MSTQTQVRNQAGSRPLRAPMRGTTRLVGFYFFLSAATLAGLFLLPAHVLHADSAVWTRVSIVAASSVLTLLFTARAARGSARAFLRLRIASAVMVIAIAVILALPGAFPLWLKLEQGLCGLLLLGVVINVNSPRLRALFTR